ncbi:SDR family NAD(P)-dependent oxidoreductase [Novosphingobium sp. JCM 18896]|uniref:SDR family NAD(P)-dependent oxidoreductase n=1 Tax=Novosphingobium sp. JCM 18896 TaxID=2989731 RepID=UPI0022220205|nr:SDR family NAD(P)-dependent oxidoreductase [Novosphingobium sp. JCM 18896]MCW1431013.1 SDR family NAD(P)-dependent oxidoreductase [Novosphingobium sp. JCM 18896]
MAGTDIRFDGRAVLVTGGGRGLGRATALLLAARGAQVVVADNGTAMDGEAASQAPADAVVAEIVAAGGTAVACTADLATEDGADAAVAASLAAFGRIDGLVHFASPCPDLKAIDRLSSRDLELVMRVNPFAALWMARAAWPHMARQHYGRIVFMPSGAIYGAMGNTDYAAAKAAYIGITRCLALEGMKDNVRVNAVSPSATTRMTERFHPSAYAEWFHATMPPEKVAAGAAWLLSEDCDVNGEIFAMGGGRIARITLAENEGAIGEGATIEEVRDLMPRVMADEAFFHPRDLGERSGKVAALFGFDGRLSSDKEFAVKPND